MIRKIQFAPASSKEGPKTEINKQFMMNDKPVQLEVSLGKEVRQTFAISTRRPLPRNPWDFFLPCLFSFNGKSLLKSRFITTAIPSLSW